MIIALLVGYWIGFAGIFILEANVGPVTPGLAMLRALVWPYYLATGRPKGERAHIIGEDE
jgi:hypothetical protein